jgi:hypothetical protein
MKYLYIFILFLTINLYCQKSPMDSPLIEIFVLAESDNLSGTDVDFTLSNVGTAWRAIPGSSPKIFEISNLVNGGTVTAILNVGYAHYTGFNYSHRDDHSYPEFAFGFYKLSVLNKYFYLDYRDTRYGSYSYCNGHCADIWIKYDYSNNSISYTNSMANVNWVPITNGEYLPIWELKNQGPPNTDNVPDFWQNCLVLIKSPNNFPYLIWGSYPGTNVLGYNLYKKLTTASGTITSVIFTTSTEYID